MRQRWSRRLPAIPPQARTTGSFRLIGSIKVDLRSVTPPRLGCIRTKEGAEKFRGRILSATVSREADRWYVSLAAEAR
jgi:putative transposase